MKILTSWDDADARDIKIAQLLLGYRLPGIFFWPVQSPLVERADADEIAKNFEIGSHGWTHAYLNEIKNIERLRHEIAGSRKYLQERFSQHINAFCYPRGRYNEKILGLVEEAGYLWARKTTVGQIYNNDPPLERQTTAHVYQRKEYGNQNWLEYAQGQFLRARKISTGIFHLWGHAAEIDRDGNWEKLEELFAFMKKNQ